MGNEEKRMNEKTAILNVRMLGDFSITLLHMMGVRCHSEKTRRQKR